MLPILASPVALALLLACIAASPLRSALAMEMEGVISGAPDPDSGNAEASLRIGQYHAAAILNNINFEGNVMGDLVEHWIVLFCTDWVDECQELVPSFEWIGQHWEDKRNVALLSSNVRFAKVDCATEKPLCKSLGIPGYPAAVHYKQHRRVSAWFGWTKSSGGAKGLTKWTKNQLEKPTKRSIVEDAVGHKTFAHFDLSQFPVRPIGLVLLLVLVARQTWMVLHSATGTPSERGKDGPSHSREPKIGRGRERQIGSDNRSILQRRLHAANSGATEVPSACFPKEWQRERSEIIL